MAQVVYFFFPDVRVTYKFINRGGDKFPQGFDSLVWVECWKLSNLKLTAQEKEWLLKQKGMYSEFIEWFSKYQFDPNELTIDLRDGDLTIEIAGSWLRTIFWEVPLMAIISELYFKNYKLSTNLLMQTVKAKKESLCFPFVDFGTRRRLRFDTQEYLVYKLSHTQYFLGTSNPLLAMNYDVPVIGTYAHEAVMAMERLSVFDRELDILFCNRVWLENWRFVYGNNYDIMLTDTITTDIFIRKVDTIYWKTMSGVRLDSGDPFIIGEKILAHYNSLGIDTKTKTLVFSDNLNPEKARKIYEHFKDRCKVIFGIGTNLTNDYGVKPLNMVIKLATVEGQGVVKLSDEPGKWTGKFKDIEKAIKIIGGLKMLGQYQSQEKWKWHDHLRFWWDMNKNEIILGLFFLAMAFSLIGFGMSIQIMAGGR